MLRTICIANLTTPYNSSDTNIHKHIHNNSISGWSFTIWQLCSEYLFHWRSQSHITQQAQLTEPRCSITFQRKLFIWSTSEENPSAYWSSSAAATNHRVKLRQLVDIQEHIYPLAQFCHNLVRLSMSSGSSLHHLHNYPWRWPSEVRAFGHTPCDHIPTR